MKIVALLSTAVLALLMSGCPAPGESDAADTSSSKETAAEAAAPSPETATAERGKPAAAEAPKVESEPEDPTTRWKREPIKKAIPAPPDVKKPPKGTTRTEAGVNILTIKPGDGGANPTSNSSVTVHYTGWTTNGRMFDSSLKSGEPATFRLGGVIAGWTDGLQYMTRGEVARLWIPEKLAYKGKPGRPKGMLVFEIELLDFK